MEPRAACKRNRRRPPRDDRCSLGASRAIREARHVLRPFGSGQVAPHDRADALAEVCGVRPEDVPPDPHRAVVAAAREGGAVWAECNAQNRADVAAEGLPQLLVGAQIPEPYRLVVARCCKGRPVGAEGEAPDDARVATQRLPDLVMGADVPEPDGRVVATGRECAPVRAEEDARGRGGNGVTELLAATDVPEPHGSVVPARGERAAVGAEGDAVREASWPADGRPELLVRAGVPESHARVAGARDRLPIRAEDDTVDGFVASPAQRAGLLARLDVPEPDGPVGAGARERFAVGAERDTRDGSRVPGQRTADRAGVGEVPEAEVGVTVPLVASAREHRPVGAEGDGVDGAAAGRAERVAELLVREQIPEPHRAAAGNRERAPVGAEGEATDLLEPRLVGLPTGADVPQPNRAVEAAGRKRAPVGAEADARTRAVHRSDLVMRAD